MFTQFFWMNQNDWEINIYCDLMENTIAITYESMKKYGF